MATDELTSAFTSFVADKKEEKAAEKAVEAPPVEAKPVEVEAEVEETEGDGAFASIRDKVKFGLRYLYSNTPKQLRWMLKSLGWVLVGTIVSAAALGAGYFLIRYLVWFLIIQLGRWLLEKIGRKIPKVGGEFIKHLMDFKLGETLALTTS
jgi:hypothetical protein